MLHPHHHTPLAALVASLLVGAAGCSKDEPKGHTSGSGGDTGEPADSAADTESGGDTDSGGDTGGHTDTGGCLTTSSEELVLKAADLAFTSTWTNGPCPDDTRFDAPLARWDLRPPDIWYADYVPLQVDAWGEVEWYGRDVWKVQFTALECTTSGSVYGTEIEVRYLVCASDGVRLAGVEYSYNDSSNDSFTVELYDPPPLLLPNDRTEGSVWSEDFDTHAFWYNYRLYPDDEGYRDGSHTLTGTMGERASIAVPAGTFDAQAVVVEGLPDPQNGSVREDEETHWAEGEGLLRWELPYFFVMGAYELVGSGER